MLGLTQACFGDIQDPPANDFGPTRKLAGCGVVRGVGRSAARHVAGLLEILTFPFPTWRDSYYPMLPPEIPYIHAGYSEFPPELGNESKYPYVRDY